jgi:hypothetical protein
MDEPIKVKLGLNTPKLYDYIGTLEMDASIQIKRHSCPNCKWIEVLVVGVYPKDTGTVYRCVRAQ